MISKHYRQIAPKKLLALLILYYLSAGMYIFFDFYKLIDSKLVMACLKVIPLMVMVYLVLLKFKTKITFVVVVGLLLSGIANVITEYQQNQNQFKIGAIIFLIIYIIYSGCVLYLWFNKDYNQRIENKQSRFMILLFVLQLVFILSSLLLQQQWSKNSSDRVQFKNDINWNLLNKQKFNRDTGDYESYLLDQDQQDLIMFSLANRNLRHYGPKFIQSDIYNLSPKSKFNQKLSYAIIMFLYYLAQSIISFNICKLFQNEGNSFVSLHST